MIHVGQSKRFPKTRVSPILVLLGALLLLTLPSPAHAVTLTTSSGQYCPGEAIIVTYEGMPGNAQDWITAVPRAEPDTAYWEWYYTGGSTQGNFTFGGLPAGSYEVRAYFDWPTGGYTVQARRAFEVRDSAACH
jgi:hypothetical protein